MPSDEIEFAPQVSAYTPGETVFGRFTLQRIVGRGGMGVVWLAWDTRLEREVAMKFLPEKLRLDETAVEDLRRETRRCLSLTHPNIVRTYDFHVDEKTAAMAMEFVDGETLTSLRLKRPGKVFVPSGLLEWLRQISEALTYAYRHEEVVHLDLKPANLMVDARGQIKITDFGISSTVTDSMQRLAPDDDLCGSPPYMSPQQIMGEPPSVSDDIYSLGVTLYEMLTGKPPFYGEKILNQIMNGTPATLAERRTSLLLAQTAIIRDLEPIPQQWEDTIARCLSKEPASRPKSVQEMVEGLLPSKPRVRLPASISKDRGGNPRGSGSADLSNASSARTTPSFSLTHLDALRATSELAVPASNANSSVTDPLTSRTLAPASLPPGSLKRWQVLLLILLILLLVCLLGITAVFSAEAPATVNVGPVPVETAKSAADPLINLIRTRPGATQTPTPIVITATEADNALLPKFVAPVKWGVTRGELDKLRPNIEIDEDPIGFGSDRTERIGEIRLDYCINGRFQDLDEQLHALEFRIPSLPGKYKSPVQPTYLLKGALAKYGPPDEIRSSEHWAGNYNEPKVHAGKIGFLSWHKGNVNIALTIYVNLEGNLTFKYNRLTIYHDAVAKWYKATSGHTETKPDPDLLTPAILAAIAADPGPSWE